MSNSEYQVAREKIETATGYLQQNHVDAWLILTREGSDPAMPLMVGVRSVHEAAIFLRKDGNHTVLCSQSDRGNYQSTGLFQTVQVYEKDFEANLSDVLAQMNPSRLMLNFSQIDHLSDGLSLGQYMMLQKIVGAEKLASIEISSENLQKQLRGIKSPTEVERLQKAIDLTIEIYDEVFSKLKCGLSEKEISNFFIQGMKDRGVTSGIGSAYDPPIVCLVRAGLAHRQPGDAKVIPGDILIMDFSVKYRDYVSDIARTVYFLKEGETQAPADIQHAFETAHRAITTVIDYIGKGKKGWQVDQVGRQVIENGGFPTVRHSVGHQIGRNCHDGGVTLGPRRAYPRPEVEGEVQVGELYAIEPTVIQDNGLPCMLVEENILITESGARILSRRQNELVLIPFRSEES
ncbi:MAG: aminopeptidase P family protein [Chloroflexi bacterium]|nr:aminopeptidase P family protein [Chloroflexota bacterium]